MLGLCARELAAADTASRRPACAGGPGECEPRCSARCGRAGGARQVTYNGWPLYLWQGDQEPGQATGQADDMGLWYVLSPSGAVEPAPDPGQAGD